MWRDVGGTANLTGTLTCNNISYGNNLVSGTNGSLTVGTGGIATTGSLQTGTTISAGGSINAASGLIYTGIYNTDSGSIPTSAGTSFAELFTNSTGTASGFAAGGAGNALTTGAYYECKYTGAQGTTAKYFGGFFFRSQGRPNHSARIYCANPAGDFDDTGTLYFDTSSGAGGATTRMTINKSGVVNVVGQFTARGTKSFDMAHPDPSKIG